MANVEKQPKSNTGNRPGGVTGKGFRPGQSGNPGGRAKGRTLMSVIRELMAKTKGKEREAVARAFMDAMKVGSIQHVKEYVEREEGKVPDRVAGPDGSDLTIKVLFVRQPPAELGTN